MKNVRIS